MVRLNFIGVRNLEGLGALGRLGLEGLLLFMYPTLFSSGSFYHLDYGEKAFHQFFGFLFGNTCWYPYVCISLPLPFNH